MLRTFFSSVVVTGAWQRHRRVIAALLVATGTLLPSPASAAADPVTKCTADKLSAVGKVTAKALACHSRAAKHGLVADQGCVDSALAQLVLGFGKAEGKAAKKGATCSTEDNAAALTTAITKVLTDLVALSGAAAQPSVCASQKVAAAAGNVAAVLKDLAKYQTKADAGKLTTARRKAITKLLGKVQKAEETNAGCANQGDGPGLLEITANFTLRVALALKADRTLVFASYQVPLAKSMSVEVSGTLQPGPGGTGLTGTLTAALPSGEVATIQVQDLGVVVNVAGAVIDFTPGLDGILVDGQAVTEDDAFAAFTTLLSSPPSTWTPLAKGWLALAALMRSGGMDAFASPSPQTPMSTNGDASLTPRKAVGEVCLTTETCGTIKAILLPIFGLFEEPCAIVGALALGECFLLAPGPAKIFCATVVGYFIQKCQQGDPTPLAAERALTALCDYMSCTSPLVCELPPSPIGSLGIDWGACTYPCGGFCPDDPCIDGDGVCVNDTCVQGTPKNCDDGDACTTDSCSAGACQHDPVQCPQGETCSGGTCGCGAGPSCPQGQVCAGGTCKLRCTYYCPAGEVCNLGVCVSLAACHACYDQITAWFDSCWYPGAMPCGESGFSTHFCPLPDGHCPGQSCNVDGCPTYVACNGGCCFFGCGVGCSGYCYPP